MTEIRASNLTINHIKLVAQKTVPHGAARLDLPSSQLLGIEGRGDVQLSSVQAGMEKIYQEGLNMRAVESIAITPDVSFEVFSTIAASPHTIFAVPYNTFESYWQTSLADHPEFSGNTDATLIEGTDNGHAKNVPTQLITWVMVKKQIAEDPRGYELIPVDVFDLAAAQSENEEDSRLKDIAGCCIDEETYMKLYQSVKKHMDLHTDFLNSLFDTYAKDQINERLKEIGIDSGGKNIWDIKNTMVIGHYRGHTEEDGKGGGPQSNPTFHAHTVAFADLNEIRRRIIRNVMTPSFREHDFKIIENTPVFDPNILYQIASLLKQQPGISHEKLAEIIETDIDTITDILKDKHNWIGDRDLDEIAVREALIVRAEQISITMKQFQMLFEKPTPPILGNIDFSDPDYFDPEAMFKQSDPYAGVFFEIMGPTIGQELQRRFGPLGGTVSLFNHSSEKDGFDMRTSEGWNITSSHDNFALYNITLNDFFSYMKELWTEGENAWKNWYIYQKDTDLRDLQAKYKLPEAAVAVLKQILPTNKQIESWITGEPMDEELRTRLTGRLKRRKDPVFLQKIAERIHNGGPLEDRAAVFGLTQILDGSYTVIKGENTQTVPFNKGYNIPGLPSFGITYDKTHEGYVFHVCPIMGMRALAEENNGTTVNRMSGLT